MTGTARYLTHPQVLIEPSREIQDWSLNGIGAARVASLVARPGVLRATTHVISSAETKALETARPIAAALGASLEVRPRMHENDRSATGFLPPEMFEIVADAFFAHPSQSVLGWETAQDAQKRIVDEVNTCLRAHAGGDVLFVGHGAVGTLLFCALSGFDIDRRHDQRGGGGCWFSFGIKERRPLHGWQVMETLAERVSVPPH